MKRRAFLLLPLAAPLLADPGSDAWDLLARAASALSDQNLSGFLACFDDHLPGYDDLRLAIAALMRLGDLRSSIEQISNEGSDTSRTIAADWSLDIVDRDRSTNYSTRRARVLLKAEKQAKGWKFTSLDSGNLFAPPAPK